MAHLLGPHLLCFRPCVTCKGYDKGAESQGACSLLARAGRKGDEGTSRTGTGQTRARRHCCGVMRRGGVVSGAVPRARPLPTAPAQRYHTTKRANGSKQNRPRGCQPSGGGDRPPLPALSGAPARPRKQHDRAARPAAAMTGLRRAAAAAVASAAFLALLLPLSRAQMVSPLQGQGRPNNSTRDVFFSMHLDRLLDGERALPRSWGFPLTSGRSWRFAAKTTHAAVLFCPCRSG